MFESNDSLDARIKSLLQQGEHRIANSTPSDVATQLRCSLDDVSTRWDALKLRFIEHGNQLTAACDEAKRLNDRVTEMMSWLNGVEQALSGLQPVSRVIDNIHLQIQRHHVTTLLNLSHVLPFVDCCLRMLDHSCSWITYTKTTLLTQSDSATTTLILWPREQNGTRSLSKAGIGRVCTRPARTRATKEKMAQCSQERLC